MIYTNSDGGCRGNPGPGAIGILVREEGEILQTYSSMVGSYVTNNIAEYEALIQALKMASKYTKEITCFLDSELIVKQLLGQYKVKDKKLLKLFLEVQKLQKNFSQVRYKHVKRWNKFQKIVDGLLNRELEQHGYPKYKSEEWIKQKIGN